jgi:hypothetical protein
MTCVQHSRVHYHSMSRSPLMEMESATTSVPPVAVWISNIVSQGSIQVHSYRLTRAVHGTSRHPQIFSGGHLDSISEAIIPSDSHAALSNTVLSYIDDGLQAELIDLYFTWQNPWFPVLDEPLFRAHLQQGSGRYFSPLLLTCVLAAGSRFSRRNEIRTNPLDPDTAGDQLVAEAEVILHFDLKSPNLTTIQAVAIMIYLYIVSLLVRRKHLSKNHS